MKREIKFRAWDTKENRMFFAKDGTTFFDSEGCFPDEIIKVMENKGWLWMQYTGLKDKNGKEIYEGDIIKDIHQEFIDSYDYFEIKWGKYGYDNILAFHPIDKLGNHFNHYYGGWESEEFEVIGNIYENPELLT